MLEKLKQIFLSKNFFVFLIIGIINTLSSAVFASIYSKIFNANLAFIFGYISGITVSYFLNSKFNFKNRLSFKKYAKFFISCIPNFIIQYISVLVIFKIFMFSQYFAYFIAAIIGLPLTFILLKFYAFTKKIQS